jgi:hypothetical protein
MRKPTTQEVLAAGRRGLALCLQTARQSPELPIDVSMRHIFESVVADGPPRPPRRAARIQPRRAQ